MFSHWKPSTSYNFSWKTQNVLKLRTWRLVKLKPVSAINEWANKLRSSCSPFSKQHLPALLAPTQEPAAFPDPHLLFSPSPGQRRSRLQGLTWGFWPHRRNAWVCRTPPPRARWCKMSRQPQAQSKPCPSKATTAGGSVAPATHTWSRRKPEVPPVTSKPSGWGHV